MRQVMPAMPGVGADGESQRRARARVRVDEFALELLPAQAPKETDPAPVQGVEQVQRVANWYCVIVG